MVKVHVLEKVTQWSVRKNGTRETLYPKALGQNRQTVCSIQYNLRIQPDHIV